MSQLLNQSLRPRVNQDHKVTFRLDESRFVELESQAYRQGVSIASILRHLVIRYLEEARRFNQGGVL